MKIIAFEGIDACGKETQAEMLVEWLREHKLAVLPESFPRYHEPIGQVIRQWLDGKVDITDEAVHMLYESDRQDFMELINWLDFENSRNSVPVCDYIVLDRYVLSNLAFGLAKSIDYEWLKQLQSKVRKPDLTFILDIEPETSVARRTQGRDKHEQDLDLLYKSRFAYLALALEDSENVIVINGEHSKEAIHEQIKGVLSTHFS